MEDKDKITIRIKSQDKWPVISISEGVSKYGYDVNEFKALEFGSIISDFNDINTKISDHFISNNTPLKIPLGFYSKSGSIINADANIEKIDNEYLMELEINNNLDIPLDLYKTASNLGGFYVFSYDINEKIMYCNWDINTGNAGSVMFRMDNWKEMISNEDRIRVVKEIEQASIGTGEINDLEFKLVQNDGDLVHISCSSRIAFDGNSKATRMFGVIKDLTKEKELIHKAEGDNKMLNMLLDIMKKKGININSIYEYAMEKAIELTESKIGYVYLYNEDNKKFTLINWSKSVMEQCKVAEPRTQYDLDKTGVWGEVIRQRKSIIVNDFKVPNEHIKGTPEGHAPLNRWCAIPVFENNKIIATLGVANKESDYTNEDLRLMDLLMQGVFDYISELKLEDEIKKKEQELTKYLDIAPMIVMERDRSGNILYINDNGAKILGGTAKELLGKNWFTENIKGEASTEMHNVFEKLWNGQMKKEETYVFKITTKDNKKKSIIWQSTLLTNEKGEPLSILTTGQDISEKQELEERIRSNEEKFKIYIKEAPVIILILDKQGNYKDVNDSACITLEYTKEQLIKMSLLQILTQRDYQNSLKGFQLLLQTGRYKGEHIFRSKNNKEIVGSVNAVKIDDDTFIAFIIDITNQVKILQEIKLRNDELSKMNKLMVDRELKMRQLKEEIESLRSGKY